MAGEMPEELQLGPKAVRLQQRKTAALNTSRGSTSDRNDHIRMLLLSKSSLTMPDQFSTSFCSALCVFGPFPSHPCSCFSLKHFLLNTLLIPLSVAPRQSVSPSPTTNVLCGSISPPHAQFKKCCIRNF